MQTRVLFVCLGNICRSPTAEGVFRHLVEAAGWSERFEIDSAGTGGWHAGEPPDPRMCKAAASRGYTLTGAARRVAPEDFDRFDHLLAMDASNRNELLRIAPPAAREKIAMFRAHDPDHPGSDVPDPYYGGSQGFVKVVEIVELNSRLWLEHFTGP